MGTVEDLLKDTIHLPSPPAIAVRILDAVKKDNHSIGDLAAIIQSDPALTARILKVANSSLYSLPIKVSSIEKALPVLGMNSLKNIALSFVISNGMKRQGNGSFDFDFFWKRSITAAVASNLVASLVKHPDDDTFITALLQDIGIIVMHLCRPDDYLRVLQDKKTTRKSVEIVETEVFGFDHQAVGAELLKLWGLPENITMPIRYHQRNEQAPNGCKVQAGILLLSDKISSVYHGTRGTEKIRDIKDILQQDFNLDHPDVASLVDAVAHKTIEILSLFEVDPGNMKPFSQILQEANEELSSLNLSYEMLVMELKQAKEKAEKLAGDLKEANERLRELVCRDSLTGLFNHGYFQELMEQELSRSQRHQRQLSLIMFDIDHFKKVNDTFGHPRGDLVLKAVSKVIRGNTRDSDILARYGGEEFALVLPETDLNGAVVLAERCRKAVEQMEIQAEGQTLKATISVGVTTCPPGSARFGKAKVIDAADKALYNSKHTGRNRISVVKLDG
jgi:diguanylate cyclase (GGDEF)-like protein